MQTYKLGALALCVLFVVGCSSTTTPAEQMRAQAEGTKDLADLWSDGNKMAQRGESDQIKAQKRLDKAQRETLEARAALDDAKLRIESGMRMAKEAEAEYTRRFPGRSLSNK